MDDSNEQICRLCLEITPSCECKTIEEIKKEILEVLPINIDLEISDYAVVCNRCLESLHNYFDFKSQRIDTFRDVDINVDIKKEVFQSELINDESIRQEDSQVCRFCTSLFEVEPLSCTAEWKDGVLLKNVVRSCLPDLDLNAGHALLVCKRCLSNITRYYEFLKHSQEIEQRIERFCQVRGHSTTGRVNLKDILTFENCDVSINPIIIKEECPDVQYDDSKCHKSEEIVNIKCEEVDIKAELGNNSCDQCTYSTNHKAYLQKHRRIHEKDGIRRMYKCNLCDYQAKAYVSLKNHTIKMHMDPSKVPTFKCALCPYESTLKKNLSQHITRRHNHKEQSMFKCALCRYTTPRKGDLKRHSLTHQKAANIKCDRCDFRTKQKRSLQHHMKLHDHVKPPMFKCDKCEYSTFQKGTFKRHKMTHMKLRPTIVYKCKLCDYQAKANISLNNHMTKIHTDPSKVPTFKCAHCPYESTLKRNLSQHITRRHNLKNQSTFKCTLCRFVTKVKEYLRKHSLITHGIIYTMKCDQCNFRTKQAYNLQRHMKVHDTVKPPIFKCDKCEYSTWRKCNFKQHKITHMELSEAIAYKCDVCGYQTKYRITFRNHIKRCCFKKNDKKTTIG